MEEGEGDYTSKSKGLWEKRILSWELCDHWPLLIWAGKILASSIISFRRAEGTFGRVSVNKRVEGRKEVWESLAPTPYQAGLLEMGVGNLRGK